MGIAWTITIFLPRSINLAVFYLGETTFFKPAAAIYILIMVYYLDTNLRANLNINFWYCLWHFRGVRLLITRQKNIGAMAKHCLFGNWSFPWTIGKNVTKNWVHAMIPYKCTFFFKWDRPFLQPNHSCLPYLLPITKSHCVLISTHIQLALCSYQLVLTSLCIWINSNYPILKHML